MNKKQTNKKRQKVVSYKFLKCFRVLQLVIKKIVLKNVKKKIENKFINK